MKKLVWLFFWSILLFSPVTRSSDFSTECAASYGTKAKDFHDVDSTLSCIKFSTRWVPFRLVMREKTLPNIDKKILEQMKRLIYQSPSIRDRYVQKDKPALNHCALSGYDLSFPFNEEDKTLSIELDHNKASKEYLFTMDKRCFWGTTYPEEKIMSYPFWIIQQDQQAKLHLFLHEEGQEISFAELKNHQGKGYHLIIFGGVTHNVPDYVGEIYSLEGDARKISTWPCVKNLNYAEFKQGIYTVVGRRFDLNVCRFGRMD